MVDVRLKEVVANIQSWDFEVLGKYKMDKQEADKFLECIKEADEQIHFNGDSEQLVASISHLETMLKDAEHKWCSEECKQDHEMLLGWLIELQARRQYELDWKRGVADA